MTRCGLWVKRHYVHYVRQLGCAVGGVLVLIAKSEWRGGDQKKMEKMEFDMPTRTRASELV